jgi:hypothetical protein
MQASVQLVRPSPWRPVDCDPSIYPDELAVAKRLLRAKALKRGSDFNRKLRYRPGCGQST